MKSVTINHPSITRAYRLEGLDEDGTPRSILWVETQADWRLTIPDAQGRPIANKLRQEVWVAVRDNADQHGGEVIIISPINQPV